MTRSSVPPNILRKSRQLQRYLQEQFPVVYRRAPDFWRLTRMDKPIGIFLLLWPTLWCLWIAAQGIPDFKLLVIFVLRSEEHTSELQSQSNLVCRLLLEKKKAIENRNRVSLK